MEIVPLILAFLWLMLLPVSTQAQFTFTTNNGAITITGYTGPGGNVAIPGSTNGYPVKTIGVNAFKNRAETSVTIPNSVTNIGNNAFLQCSSLTNVTIGNSVIYIGNGAFYNCQGLTSVTNPSSVTSIGNGAFGACSHLTNIAVNAANPNYASDVGVLFSKALTTLIQCPGGLSGGYVIPDSVTNLNDSAFYSCSSLTSVTMPGSITSIGFQTFFLCLNLTNVAIPNSVTDIGDNAFSYCPSLMNLMIPSSVTRIGNGAFGGCSSLKSVTIPNSVASIGGSAFSGCSGLTNLIVGSGVTSIGDLAFGNCSGLHQAYFAGSAPSEVGIGGTAFQGETGTVYYLPSTTGWGATFGGWPTAGPYQLQPQILGSDYGLGGQSNGFQFTTFWATNTFVVVEASTNLQNWTPVVTNMLINGTNAFGDSTWTNFPQRFYRVRSQ